MKRSIILLILAAIPAFARTSATGWCSQGNQVVVTPGSANSTTKVMRSYPSCTVTVTIYGGGAATLYSDNSGTALANPFTATSTGQWTFFADANEYTVTLSGAGIASPFAINVYLPSSSSGITSLNALTAATQLFAVGTSGTDFAISSATATHTFNLPTASATNRGALSTTDWSTFNAKQSALTFTAPLVNTAGTVALTVPITIARGGTGQTTQTLGFNALSPLTTKGDIVVHNGTNNIRFAKCTDTYAVVGDSGAASGLNCAAFPSIPVTVSQGGTGATSLTGVPIGTGTSAFTAVAASADLRVFRRKPNLSTLTYEFAAPPYLVNADFDFPAQTPGGTISAGVGATATLTPCPLGLNGADPTHYIYLTGGTGTPESVLITGGTCTSGASTGSVTFTPANAHSSTWTIISATSGIQEAVCATSTATPEVTVRGAVVLNASVSYCGKTTVDILLSIGVSTSGSGSFPSTTTSQAYLRDQRSGLLYGSVGANISSATTIAPVAQITHITGTTNVVNITVPTGFTSGCLVLVPDGVWATTNAGNIALASTAVVSKAMTMCYDPGTAKFYPSY